MGAWARATALHAPDLAQQAQRALVVALVRHLRREGQRPRAGVMRPPCPRTRVHHQPADAATPRTQGPRAQACPARGQPRVRRAHVEAAHAQLRVPLE